ncbi:EamA/RhaT family transporter [Candidatus Woesearchaeota archaeon]|nr:EamA/RhaT family transporter [Candidatus Woesearchaeota archaeon]
MRQKSALILALICTLCTSLGQLLWKYGADPLDYVWLFVGFIFYGIGALLMILALRSGDLSFVHPLLATSYIWVTILSVIVFPNDVLNAWKIAGVGTIIISVILLSIGSTHEQVSPHG